MTAAPLRSTLAAPLDNPHHPTPLYLRCGRVQEDIPALVAAAQQQHPGVECVLAEPIGIDALMAQLIEHRVQAAAEAAADQPAT